MNVVLRVQSNEFLVNYANKLRKKRLFLHKPLPFVHVFVRKNKNFYS